MVSFHTGPVDDPSRYRIDAPGPSPIAEPGGGGDGLVYRAHVDHAPDGPGAVALKVMLRLGPADLPDLRRRLAPLAAIDHPHLMRHLEAFAGTALVPVGEPSGEPDVCWTVSEWVDGTTASVGSVQDANHALAVTSQIARAVDELHRHGVLHRDVRAQNVRLRPDGSAVLTDHGCVTSAPEAAVEVPDLMIGAPGWLAPEVAAGGRSGAAADRWAVGALAHALVTGLPPILDGAACARERLVLATRNSGLPRCWQVCDHVAALLATNPDERPHSLRAWADRLDRLRGARRRLALPRR